MQTIGGITKSVRNAFFPLLCARLYMITTLKLCCNDQA